jgi:GT2 family glycosyltransferase
MLGMLRGDSMARVSVITVTHSSRDAVGRTLPSLAAELHEGDEVIVVDNASTDGTPARVAELLPEATVIETGENLGYGGACNRGAAAASGELLVFLNPDAVPAPGFRDAIERPLAEASGWSAWQGLVTAEDGRVVNTRGGVVHYTGIAWAGGAGLPLADAEASSDSPGFLSGACLAIRREEFAELGGFAEEFFLYHEDVDLSLRLRLAGRATGVVPEARVDHDYDFDKGPGKWRHLERNRWATIVRTYPGQLLLLVAPALLATEVALLPVALAGGWLPQKLAAWGDVARALPRLIRQRRRIAATRIVGAREFARALTADLDSPYLGRLAGVRAIGALSRAYWSAVLALLGDSAAPARPASDSG